VGDGSRVAVGIIRVGAGGGSSVRVGTRVEAGDWGITSVGSDVEIIEAATGGRLREPTIPIPPVTTKQARQLNTKSTAV